MPDSRPVVCRPYKTTPADREKIGRIVSEWKRHGLVSEMTSLYASPVLLFKQNNKNRLCVDYRRLNKQTVKQHFPLPDMLEQLESLAKNRLFIQLNLTSGYLQIPLTDETKGQFNRIPFGLSAAEFTRLIQKVLGPLQGKIVRNYLNDTVIDGED